MPFSFSLFRIFTQALAATVVVTLIKYLLHLYGLEPIEQSSLHNTVASGVFFVVGFVLSATIADYKESERIPAEVAANVESLYEDAASIHASYPVFSLTDFRAQLRHILATFGTDVRTKRHDARHQVHALNRFYVEMEGGGVPANFIVKLKTQQVVLLRALFRVNYIQTIHFIPSASILVRSIVALLIGLLLFTNVDPYYGSLAVVAIVTFILTYMLILITVISTPFHAQGTTRDDVSLYLLDEVDAHLDTRT